MVQAGSIMESFKLLILFLVFGTTTAANVAPNKLTQALVCSARGDTKLNVSNGVMYYVDGNIQNINSLRIKSFTGYGIDRLAYDYENKTIYFYSATDYVTYEIFKEDPSSPHSYRRSTGPASGLAYDWLAKNLYYTDTYYKWVWLFSTRGSRQTKMIIPRTSDRVPFAIALSPVKSWLFISDIGKEPKIERATLSGDNLKSIISIPGGKVTSLTIDESASRLYWAEQSSGRIGNSDFSGKDIKHFTASPGVVSIAVFKSDLIFALDNKTNSVILYVKGIKLHEKAVAGMTGAKDIIAYDASTQPGQSANSPCLNKGCAQICVGDGGSGKCLCFEGYSLESDGKSCTLDLPMIVFSKGHTLCRYIPNAINTGFHCYSQFYEEKDIKALTFDASAREIFYANSAGYINAYPTRDYKGAKVTPLIQTEGKITALAYDWKERNIYWLDVKRNEIGMAPKTGKGQKSVIIKGLEKVSSIVLEPLEGYLFWSRRKPTPAIMRAKRDGTGATKFISTDISDPRGMAINYKQKRFFWIETDYPTGYATFSVDLEGGDRKLESNAKLNFTINKLAVDESHIYFTMVDGQYAGLHSFKPGSRVGTNYFGSKIVYDVIAYDPFVQPSKFPKSTGGMGPRGNHSLVVLIVLAIFLQFTSPT